MLRHRWIGVLVALFLSIWTAVAAAAPFAYITNSGNLSVSVIDLATNSVTSIPLALHSPWGVAVSPSGTHVVVTHLLPAGKVSVINTSTNPITITALSVGMLPTSVTINPSGTRAYVTNFGSTFLSIIDLTTNPPSNAGTVLGVGSGGRGLVFSPDGSRLYVARRVSAMGITVVNANTNSVEGTLPAGVDPAGLAILPNGSRLYVANEGDGTVTVVDPVNGTITATVGVGSAPLGMAIHPDGSRAYAANSNSNSVSIINTATNAVIGEVTVGLKPFGVDVSANGKVYVANRGSNSVSVIDPVSDTVTEVSVGSSPIAFGRFIQPLSALTVQIDIMPGGNPNMINLRAQGTLPGAQGTLPVAILGSAEFNVATVDPATVTLAGAGVVMKKNGPMASMDDVNGDGFVDLVVHVARKDLKLQAGDTEAVLEGKTYDRLAIRGTDSVVVIH